MRICVFMHRFDDGGAERVTICLLNELKKRGHEITLAIRYNYGPSKQLLSDDIEIIDMNLPENGKFKKNILNVKHLIQLIKSGKYDIIVPILSDMSQVTSLAKRLSGSKIPVVSVVHSTLSLEKISFAKIRKLLGRFFDRKYDKVITVSETVRRDYIAYAGPDENKVITVYNPIVNERMIELSKERPEHPWLSDGRSFKTLILAGRLNYAKNHPLMFKALKILREKEDFRLILLGEGEAKENLEIKYPGINVCGTYSPPFGFEKDENELKIIRDKISAEKPDFMIACFGCPKQEKFIYENYMNYDAYVSVCAGATVDFLAGNVKRAPKWMQDNGLEWLFRITQDPKRLIKRYLIDDTKILGLIIKYRGQRVKKGKKSYNNA